MRGSRRESVAIACAMLAGCFAEPTAPIDPFALPGPLQNARMAFDQNRNHVVLYGGAAPSHVSAAMWELTDAGWSVVCDPCDPGRRIGFGFAFDRHRGVLVLYGGFDSAGAHNEVWEMGASGLWSQALPTTPAPKRRELQLVYDDADRRIFAFGGVDENAAPQLDGRRWDGQQWMDDGMLAQGIVTDGAEAVYDVKHDRTLAMGDVYPALADTLAARPSANSWGNVCMACLGMNQRDATMVYDPAIDAPLLFAGATEANGREPGTWQLVTNAQLRTQWMKVAPTPPGREGRAVAYDEAANQIVLYGGYADPGNPCGGPCNAQGCYCAELTRLPGAMP